MQEGLVSSRLSEKQSTRLTEISHSVNLEEVLHLILQKISDGILFLDLEGKILYASRAAGKMTKQPCLRASFWDLFHDDQFGFSMREALRYGISHHRIYASWGSSLMEISSTFLFEGPQKGLCIQWADRTPQQQLFRMQDQKSRMEELGLMASKLAHEIRNPLGAIRGFTTLLIRDLEEQKHLQEMAIHVLDGAKGLEKLVITVLQFAKPATILLKTGDLSQFLRTTAKFLKADLPPTIQFQLHVPDLPILLPFDAEALKRALLNLFLNAVQAMPSGGKLLISLLNLTETCQITITDTGIGMTEEQLSSLFVPFYSTKPTGTGIGLVETKKIVQAHGGTIDVRSSPHRGTSFTITLPARIL